MLVLRVLLLPLNFIPLAGIVVHAGLRSLTMGRVLHEPFFKAKGLTPEQRELFIAERSVDHPARPLISQTYRVPRLWFHSCRARTSARRGLALQHQQSRRRGDVGARCVKAPPQR